MTGILQKYLWQFISFRADNSVYCSLRWCWMICSNGIGICSYSRSSVPGPDYTFGPSLQNLYSLVIIITRIHSLSKCYAKTYHVYDHDDSDRQPRYTQRSAMYDRQPFI